MKSKHAWLLAAGLLSLAAGCTDSAPGHPFIDSAETADLPFEGGPLYLTGAFDGSKAFRMWLATMEFAREVESESGKPLRFTYFINSSYLDPGVERSWIGRARSQKEATVRFAVMQQAINEGHEIANHTVRHQDGSEWTVEQWRSELGEFHDLVERNLFEPVLDAQGVPVFPRWRPMPSAQPGEVGASCQTSGDCASNMCLQMTPGQGFCSTGCNKNLPCANGTVCGAPDWNESQDRCLPMPEFPVVHDGEVLFDEAGVANVQSSQLESYPIIGFRAPQLGHNRPMFEVLEEIGYRYDTSKILRPGKPSRVHSGRLFPSIYEFALMKNSGSATVPMDYNYKFNDVSGARMTEDYKKSVRDAYARGREPWNMGHHFSLWKGGAYWQAMKETFRYAAKGCPEGGQLTCENVEFPTFVELADELDRMNRQDGGLFPAGFDLFGAPGIEEPDTFMGEQGHGHDLEEL